MKVEKTVKHINDTTCIDFFVLPELSAEVT